MNSENYIISNVVPVITAKYPTSKVRYENADFYESHTIEITPDSIHKDENFHSFYMDIVLDFIAKYPEENLSIIDSKNIVPLENVTYETRGSKNIEVILEYLFESTTSNNDSIEITNINNNVSLKNIDTFNGSIMPQNKIDIQPKVTLQNKLNLTNFNSDESISGLISDVEDSYSLAA